MTNRDYLRGLNDEELAKFILSGNEKICNYMASHCGDDCCLCGCLECITKWLDTERETHVEEGQIRETDSIKWLVTSVNVDRTNCSMLSEEGVIRDFPTDVVDTWKIVTDEIEEMFYNRAINNSYNNEEINK